MPVANLFRLVCFVVMSPIWPVYGDDLDHLIQIPDKFEMIRIEKEFTYFIKPMSEKESFSFESFDHKSITAWKDGSSSFIDEGENKESSLIYVQKMLLKSSTEQHIYWMRNASENYSVETRLLVSHDGSTQILRPIDRFKPLFEINLKPGLSELYLVHFDHDAPKKLGVTGLSTILSSSYYPTFSKINHFGSGLVYGISIGMLLYNLAMVIFFRKLYFLWYCGYVMSMITWLMFLSGHLVPRWSSLWLYGNMFSNLFGMLFVSSVISAKNKYRYSFYLYAFFVVVLGYGTISYNGFFVGIGTAGCAVVGTSMCIRSAYSGYKPAYFFVLGWFFLWLVPRHIDIKAYYI